MFSKYLLTVIKFHSAVVVVSVTLFKILALFHSTPIRSQTSNITISGTLAVVSQTGQTLSFFDIASGERTAHITDLTSEPHELCYDARRNLLYLSHTYRFGHFWKHGENSHEISVINLHTKKVVDIIDTRPAKAPHGLILDQQKDTLYISVEELPNQESGGGGIITIDLETRKIIRTIPSAYKSHWFAMTPDAKKAYTCNKDASFISIIDLEREKMIGKIDVPGCEEPSMSPDGKHAYFPTPGFQFGKNPANPVIKVIDTTTDQIVHEIKMDKGALSTHVGSRGTIFAGAYTCAESGSAMYAADGAGLAMYHPETRRKLGEVGAGVFPLTIRTSPDERLGFLTSVTYETVTVIDLKERSVLRTLVVDGRKRGDKFLHVGAHGMAFIA